ncbi:MAG: thrombospondin type 3 repeat-containing protein [Luteolibacter sp.]
MNPVPVTESAWTSNPFEAQYLKLYDITPPPVPDAPLSLNGAAYQIGSEVAFEWSAADDPEGGLSGFRVQLGSAAGQADLLDTIVTDASVSLGGLPFGSVIFARVSQINQAGIEGDFSDSSIGVVLLDPSADSDGDGQSNAAEQLAQTDPLDASSRLHVMSIRLVDGDVSLSISSIAGVGYQLQTSNSLEDGSWIDLGETVVATDLVTELTHPAGQEASRRFYRIRVVP